MGTTDLSAGWNELFPISRILARMITVIVVDRETGKLEVGRDPKSIDELCANDRLVVWVDVLRPTEEDYALLANEFHFHPLAIEDCRHAHQRPKIDEYKGYYFMVLYEASIVGRHKSLELNELNLFLGPNYLVTIHRNPLRAVDTAARLWPEWEERVTAGAGLLAYLLIDAVIDEYMPLLDNMSDRIDDIEDAIFESFDPDAIREIFLIKKQLLYLRRTVVPLRDVFNTLLRREQPIFPREIHVYFQDVFDHVIRVADLIDTLREMLVSTMDAYLSLSGNRMNVVMKRLTSISTILMSMTLIAGIYGMNFEFMPELKWHYGYVGSLLSMAVVGVVIYFYLRYIDWL